MRFNSFSEFIMSLWGKEKPIPTHAYVRYFLSIGIKWSEFNKAYEGLKDISKAFGRKAIIVPAILDQHEVEVGYFNHSTNSESGQHEAEINWKKLPIKKGPHLMVIVESNIDEKKIPLSMGILILDAIESTLRMNLGANALIDTRNTSHIEIATGKSDITSESLTVFGPEESPKAGIIATNTVSDFMDAYEHLPDPLRQRVVLGLHWINVAFKNNELLSFWTAYEILSGGYGEKKVFSLFAKAYKADKPQKLAIELGLKYIYDLRNQQVHSGQHIFVNARGTSFLLAIANDLIRELLNLPSTEISRHLIEDTEMDITKELNITKKLSIN